MSVSVGRLAGPGGLGSNVLDAQRVAWCEANGMPSATLEWGGNDVFYVCSLGKKMSEPAWRQSDCNRFCAHLAWLVFHGGLTQEQFNQLKAPTGCACAGGDESAGAGGGGGGGTGETAAGAGTETSYASGITSAGESLVSGSYSVGGVSIPKIAIYLVIGILVIVLVAKFAKR